MKSKLNYLLVVMIFWFLLKPCFSYALDIPLSLQNKTEAELKQQDSDNDGLSDYDELNIYHTDTFNSDTDKDGWKDGDEVLGGYDPNIASDEKIQKTIEVSLSEQTLKYFLGSYKIGEFKISSGLARTPTPKGDFSVQKKMPIVTYGSKTGAYYFPNTKWNLFFKQGSWGGFYIHGAYWHKNFGHPMSHGCINVAYNNMEGLYNWAEVGTKIKIY